jgi:hypothetical protein
MNTDKHTCVCATCGQGFTRKSSAARHNYNLHSGQVIIVKPYDYIVGRLNGEFSQGDPAAYRRDRRGLTNPFVNNVRPNTGIHTDMHTLRPSPSNTMYPVGFQGRSMYPGNPHRPTNQNQNVHYFSNRVAERNSKLKELERLLYQNYSPQAAAQQLDRISYLVNERNDDAYLEPFLDSLRLRSSNA